MIDRTLPRISKPIHVGLLRKLQGDILSDMKEHEGSLGLYRSALGIFRAERTRMLELSTLNNMGVTQFRQDRFDAAMRTWQKVRNLCIERDYVMMKALVGLNLADSYARIGKVKRAHAILRESAQVFEAIGDLESLSMVEFNRALVYVEEGKKDRALEHFSVCMRFPFVSELKAGERRDVLRARFAAKGWSCPV
jgi:tetratricopeptide (TPR) repeat protein